jgi:peptidoglycan/LPS O-acetylase OafA/YrhL
MATSETKRIADFPLFDWLRIAMAGTVAAGHAGLLPWGPGSNLAVQVFFALSGWLIGTILLEMTGDKLPLFYFNRTTRVWVPYFLALTLLYAVSLAREPIGSRWLEFLTYDVTFTHNLFTLTPSAQAAIPAMPLKGAGNHFWSIAVEEQFYLVAPLILLFVPGGRRPAVWAALGVAMILIRQEFSAIALGVAAAAMQARHPDFHTRGWASVTIVATVAVTTVAMFSPSYYHWVSSLFAICLVLLLARPGKRGKLGRFAGGISYPLYLNHWIALATASGLAKHLGGPVQAWTVAALLLALVIASVAYWLVDRQIMLRRGRWYTQALGWRLAVLSYLLVGTGLAVGLGLHGNTILQLG